MFNETNLLVVEADCERRAVISRILQENGYGILETNDVEEGMRLAISQKPSLIIVGVRQGNDFGGDFRRLIKDNKAFSDVFVLQILPAASVQTGELSGDNYCESEAWLTEPFSSQNLISTVQMLIKFQQTQRELKLREERYRALAAASSQIVCSANADGLGGEIAKIWEELTGQAAEAAENWGWLERVHPEDRESARAAWQHSIETLKPLNIEYRIHLKSGKYRNFAVRCVPVYDSDGSFREWIGTFNDVTEQRRTQETLAQQSALLALSHEPIFVWELEGGIVHWNRGCESLYGFSIADALGRNAHDLLQTQFPAPSEEFNRHLRENRIWSGEIRQRKKDGSEILVETRMMLRELGGRQLVLETNRDVTESKAAAVALQQSEERYRAFIEQSSEGIWRFEVDNPFSIDLPVDEQVKLAFKSGYLAECNDAMAKMYAYDSASELVGSRLTDLFVMEDPANFEYIRGFIESNYKLADTESHELAADGSDKHFLNSLIGIIEDGRLVRAWGTQRDISQQKQAESILARYKLLSDRARDIILLIRSDGRIVEANRAAAMTYGYDLQQLLEMNVRDLRAPETLSLLSEQLTQADEGGVLFETVHKRSDGSVFPVEVSSVGADIGGERLLLSIIRDITERKQAEENLRKANERFHIAEEASNGFLYDWNPTQNRVERSAAISKVLGYSPEELKTSERDWKNLIHPEDRERASQCFWKTVRSGKRYAVEYRVLHKDGHYVHVLDKGLVVRDAGKAPIRVVGTTVDISEQKRAQEKLRESEERFKIATEAAGVSPWRWDLQTNKIYLSPLHGELWGANETEIANAAFEDWAKRIFAGDQASAQHAVKQARETRGLYESEYRIVRGDGKICWIRSVGRFFYDDSGEPVEMYGVDSDITERKRAQEALLEAERRAADQYQALLSRIVPLAQVLGTAHDLQTIYRTICKFIRSSMPCIGFFVSFYEPQHKHRIAAFGWAEGEELDSSQLPPMLVTDTNGPNSRAIRTGNTIVIDSYRELIAAHPHLLVGDDNGMMPDSSLVAPMVFMNRVIGTIEVQAYESRAYSDEHKVALEMVSSLAAVAVESVRLLERERVARADAEAANRAKDEFLAVLSHELRTPLNSMFGWVRMLNSGQLDEEKTRRAIDVIEKNIGLQTKLIEDILDVSRIISGKTKLEKRDFDFSAVVNSVVELTRPTAETKRVEIKTEVPKDGCTVNADAERLQQIVSNLISNAVKFTPSGGSVFINLDCKNNWAILAITDTGLGIAPEFLPHVFDRFRQADSSTKRKHGGLGLGLAIVKHLVELHGGEVAAYSEGDNTGATFTVRLPMQLNKQIVDDAPAGVSSNGHEAGELNLKGISLLLVDDDTDALEMLRTMLQARGATVVTFNSAPDALERLQNSSFDILVSDIGMPEMDGIEFIGRVRKLESENGFALPAIALTAYASAEDRERILAAGFTRYLPKPINLTALLNEIGIVLASKQAV